MHDMLKRSAYLIIILLAGLPSVYAKESPANYRIENGKLAITVAVDQDGYLKGDSVIALSNWSNKFGKRPFGVSSNAGFKLNIMWSAWSAPGKSSNGQNLVSLTQDDFIVTGVDSSASKKGSKQLILDLKGTNVPLELHLIYQLDENAFYVRRKVEVKIPEIKGAMGKPYVRRMWPVFVELGTSGSIIKKGGFGQPVALHPKNNPETGIFWGMEYPTAQNKIRQNGSHLRLQIGDYYGKQISTDWTSSDWVVIGLTPEKHVKQWFMRYVDDIRAQPVRPYLLYNSWYDLEAPQMVDDPNRVMNEKNTLRSIKSLQQRLTTQRGVALDAFVLDDGWDIY